MLEEQLQAIDSQEEILVEQGKRIRALHEIISRPDLSFDQQIDAALNLGCQFLGTEIGKVGRQDPVQNTSEFLNTVVLSDLGARRGMVLPLDKTFCQVTFNSPDTIAINNIAESSYKDHPAASFLGMQSYIGCTINVHGKKFGTVNFANRTPVKRPFTEADKDLVKLIGSWISVMMERQLEAEELKKSKEAADAANQAKSSFLACMSHEIRTPLTSIIGYAESGLDDDQTMQQRVDALVKIRQSSDHLLNLINDILDFSKIEAGAMDIETAPIKPLQLLSEVESIMVGHAKKKNLNFKLDYQFPLPARILSDPLRLKQILLNICSNAIKFTETGSVKVLLSYDLDQDILKFTVKDTGIGMSPESMQQIFKPFKQADTSVSRRFGGTGLGLCLSARIAQLLNAALEASSEVGVGSEFSLSMYQAQAEVNPSNLISSLDEASLHAVIHQDQINTASLSGKVLLAEDNDMIQQLMKIYLGKMGLDVVVAENGLVALNMVQQTEFDLIFMDMQMPVMSGLEAVVELRKGGYAGPIIMLTANATLNDRKLSKEAGSDDFLTKPINRQHLYELSRQYLEANRHKS